MMNKIATDLVVEQAVTDKLKQAEREQTATQKQHKTVDLEEGEQEDQLNLSNSSMSSGEREVMRKYKEKVEAKMNVENGKGRHERAELTGSYDEKSEKEFFELIEKKKERILCHFFHEDFVRCKLLDKHLASAAFDHPETLFIRINAQQAPFIVTKLKIKVLPAIYYFKDGSVKDMIVGFEEFGNGDDFRRHDFLSRLAKYGAIELTSDEQFKLQKKPKQKILGESDSSDDDK